jgi:hypothetical protein
MIVCPYCRASNEEDRETCDTCGRSLEPGPVALAPQRKPESMVAPLEIAEPTPPSKWRPYVIIGGLVAVVAAVGTFLLLRPDPCSDTNFTSEAFGYCLNVPDGWTAEPALFGADVTLDQFAPPTASTTVVVEAVDLQQGADLEQWAAFVRQQDTDAGLTPGPASEAVLDGVAAQQWDVTVTSDTGTDYRMREVVVVRDEVGWRITLNDLEDRFDVSAASFEAMLESWRFR